MKIVISALLTLLLISCGKNLHTNYETEEQTDKKFVGKWKLLNYNGDLRTFPLTKVPGSPKTYHFGGMFDEYDFIKKDDNTLVYIRQDGTSSFELEYHPENDHITGTLPSSTKKHIDEFIRVE